MVVEAVMTREVVTVSADDTLEHVREVFRSHAFHHLVVMDGDKVAGVMTDRDLLKNLSPFIGTRVERAEDEFLLKRKVHQAMERKLVSVKPGTLVRAAAAALLEQHVSCLPVIDEAGKLQGVITWHDLLRYMVTCTTGLPGCSVNGWKAA
jgi:acetoin utilization protein AcuB